MIELPPNAEARARTLAPSVQSRLIEDLIDALRSAKENDSLWPVQNVMWRYLGSTGLDERKLYDTWY